MDRAYKGMTNYVCKIPKETQSSFSERNGHAGVILVSTLLSILLLAAVVVHAQARSDTMVKSLSLIAKTHREISDLHSAKAILLPLAPEAIMVAAERRETTQDIKLTVPWNDSNYEATLNANSNFRNISLRVTKLDEASF